MIKVVAQAILTYAMGSFDLGNEICDQISTIICIYWCSQQENEKKDAPGELGHYEKVKKNEERVFETSMLSTWLCLQNRAID